jgi:hypothetical protein
MNTPYPMATLNTSIDAPIGEAMTQDAAYILTGEALRAVIAERMEQVEIHGHTLARDAQYQPFDLALAAKAYADAAIDQLTGLTAAAGYDLPQADPDIWPWHPAGWKPGTPRANLVKAAALIWAAIDRLDHAPVDADPSTTGSVTPDRYRGWLVSFDHPPIPYRQFDWSATHPDYDGAEDAGDDRVVHGETRDDVIAAIDAWYAEAASPDDVAGIESPAIRTCRNCGCTDERACMDGGEPCSWVDTDLCSACVPHAALNDALMGQP